MRTRWSSRTVSSVEAEEQLLGFLAKFLPEVAHLAEASLIRMQTPDPGHRRYPRRSPICKEHLGERHLSSATAMNTSPDESTATLWGLSNAACTARPLSPV